LDEIKKVTLNYTSVTVMVAGLVSGAVAGLELPAMLRQGAACGTAAALHAMH
jgi:fructose-1-phosphate kinase PfkB-like protein